MKKMYLVLLAPLFFLSTTAAAGPNENPAGPAVTIEQSAAAGTAATDVRGEYLAEQKVKMLLSRHGDTIESYMNNMVKIPMAKDLGWEVHGVADGYEVQRSILINNEKIIRYKWLVSGAGEVTPMNDEARALMNQ